MMHINSRKRIYMSIKVIFIIGLLCSTVLENNNYDLFFSRTEAAIVDYDKLRMQNNYKLADNPKMIYTTEPALCFAFAGLSKPDVVYKTLKYLENINAKATFFVMVNDIRKNQKLIKDIINSGNEVAIGLRSLKDSDFYTTCKEIEYVQSNLAKMGVYTDLVMQPWGQITDETREAVSAMGCQMVSPTLNLVNSDQKNYVNAVDVVGERIGKFTYSFGRGWIIYYRLDYYDNDNLVVDVMDLIKRHKIDNVEYITYNDDALTNEKNKSAYKLKSIGDVLSNKDKTYKNEVLNNDIKDKIDFTVNHNLGKQKLTFNEFLENRYIGNYEISAPKQIGFSLEEKHYLDLDGRIRTNNKQEIFFTFDDWGTDSSVNQLLYVLRKHNIKSTFFILTHNITNNPNLLYAIAEDGHDIASHSEFHKKMGDQDFITEYNSYLIDYATAYNKLKYLVGDIKQIDGTSVFKPYFRPPTLNISKAGFKAVYDTGYEYIVSGSYSVHDYEQPDLDSMINSIKTGIYDKDGNIITGSVLVMHMSDVSMFTPIALDLLLTENEKRDDNDPAKFIPIPLSNYLKDGYSQAK